MSSKKYDRAGQTVSGLTVVYRRLKTPIAEFVYEGLDERGTLHLWQENGRWQCDPHTDAHPFDLNLHASQ